MAGLVAALALLPCPAAAQTSPADALRLQQVQLDTVRVQLGQSIADGLAAQLKVATALRQNRQDQEAVGRSLADADARVRESDAQLSRLDTQISALDTRIVKERQVLAALARDMYFQPDSIGLQLAESSGPADFVTRVADLASAGARARALKERLDADQKQVADDRRRQAAVRADQAAARDRIEADLARLRELQAAQQAVESQLAAKLAQLQAELASVQVQSATTARLLADSLQAEQAEIIASAQQSVWSQVQGTRGGAPEGAFVVPMAGVVTQGFGPSSCWCEPPYGGYAHFHTGIDYAAAAGTPVVAAGDGVVIQVGAGNSGYGNYVVIAHGGGINTLYGHLQQAAVATGQAVTRGRVIGLEGSTGNSTGPHLHFEMRSGSVPFDPLTRLGRG